MKKRKSKRKAREWWCLVNRMNHLYPRQQRLAAKASADWLNENGDPSLAPYRVIKVREVLR